MTLALYRKYRPQTFKDLIGQNHIKITLQSELVGHNLAHAYLFSGPRGLGKTTTARLLAKAVNCLDRQDGDSEPCNACVACKQILDNRTMDVIEIDAASHTGVDNVRENIIENSRFTPNQLKFKVFIIDEVHMLSTQAFNALLKTLEEPPAHVMFILATTEIHKVPSTIISRCQHFDFRPVPHDDLFKRLSFLVSQEKKTVDDDILTSIIYYSGGSIRDAESLLGQILSLDKKKITVEQAELILPRARFDLVIELLEYINKKNIAASLTLINDLVQTGVDLEKFCDNLIEILRKLLLLKISPELDRFATIIDKDASAKLLMTVADMKQVAIVKAIDILIRRRPELRSADIKQLPLELAILEIIGQDESNESSDIPKKIIPSVPVPEKKVEPEPIETEIKYEPIPEPIKVSSVVTSEVSTNITLDQVIAKWHDVLDQVRGQNYSLASTLKIAQPVNLTKDRVLELALEHDFHLQMLSNNKNRELIESILDAVFKTTLILKFIKSAKVTPVKPNKDVATAQAKEVSIDDLASAFGGQIVE